MALIFVLPACPGSGGGGSDNGGGGGGGNGPGPGTIACNDDKDNDGDGFIDLDDPGCIGLLDTSEYGAFECDNGVDDDGDTKVDFPDDLSCTALTDTTEIGANQCDDLVDNDGDTFIDFPADPSCTSLTDNTELGANQCDDLVDNDGDTFIDFPDDPSCTSLTDNTEMGANECDDVIDNDGDTVVDLNDPGCMGDIDGLSETGECQDGSDNDGDTLIDFPSDPGCEGGITDITEINPSGPACDDGIDNDGDTVADLYDLGCMDVTDIDELGTNECDDGNDNDGDTLTDIFDPGCLGSPAPLSEIEECKDGNDNDGDTNIDYPDDAGCISSDDASELGIPTLAGFYKPSGGATQLFVRGNYAYIVDDSPGSGLIILDISTPSNPIFKSLYPATLDAYGIFVEGNYAYLANGLSLDIIDISDPTSPILELAYPTNYTEGVLVKDNYLYYGDVDNFGFDHIGVLDVSDPPNAYQVNTFSGFAPLDLFITNGYLYTSTNVGIEIKAVNPPDSFQGLSWTDTIYDNAIYVKDNYAYIADAGLGFIILDVSDPVSPFWVYRDSQLDPYGLTISGNYAYLADEPTIIYNISNPKMPVRYHIGYQSHDGIGTDAFVQGSYFYMAFSGDGLLIIDTDTDASGVKECNDFIDNDGDTYVDYFHRNGDPGCSSLTDPSERGTDPCDDGIDNNGNTVADFPDDPGCYTVFDATEEVDCSDGVDNDADTRIDLADEGCGYMADWGTEVGQCQDGIENPDNDDLMDLNDPQCDDLYEWSEYYDCGDGIDNDGDTLTDYDPTPGLGDPVCIDTWDDFED